MRKKYASFWSSSLMFIAMHGSQNVQWHWSHLLQDTHIRMYSETGHTFCKILISECTVTLVTPSARYSYQNIQWHWSHILQDTHIRMYSETAHTFCKILTSESRNFEAFDPSVFRPFSGSLFPSLTADQGQINRMSVLDRDDWAIRLCSKLHETSTCPISHKC